MTLGITVWESPDAQIRGLLLNLMMAYNESKTGPSGFALLAVTLDDAQTGQLIGGLWGRTVYDWLFVEFLFVPEHLRGRGFGTTLLQRAEETAIARGCIGVCLDTFDFNAPGFYRKLGYEAFAALSSPRYSVQRHFFRKAIGAGVMQTLQPPRLSS
jgi:GNAT superfamily N-acetyltransferase